MRYRHIAASVGLLTALAVVIPEPAIAQSRGRAVPRGGSAAAVAPPVRGGAAVRGGPRGGYPVARHGGPVYGAPHHRGGYPYYGRAYYGGYYGYGYPYHASVNFGFFFGYPGFYGAYAWGSPYWAPYGYAPYYGAWPYGYGYYGYGGRPYGGVRIDLPERNAEVFVDGYFVGIVNDFDGKLQQANLEAGPHRIEVRNQGFEPIAFEVNVEPGRTVTYRAAAMKPAP